MMLLLPPLLDLASISCRSFRYFFGLCLCPFGAPPFLVLLTRVARETFLETPEVIRDGLFDLTLFTETRSFCLFFGPIVNSSREEAADGSSTHCSTHCLLHWPNYICQSHFWQWLKILDHKWWKQEYNHWNKNITFRFTVLETALCR